MKKGRSVLLCAAVAAWMIAIASPAPAGPMFRSGADPGEETVSRLIVKPRAGKDAGLAGALRGFDAGRLSRNAEVPLKVARPMSGRGYVVALDRPVTLSEARVIAARLMRSDAGVEYAEPDRMVRPTATTPTDPGYLPYQWHYFAPDGVYNKGGANLPDAWDVTRGSASVVVAVIDTGYLPHADFGTLAAGYDFISTAGMSNDGDGRDGDPRDPGDWVAADECGAGTPARNSSWHGTHVAGTIAALMNNGAGGTGIAPDVRILPVRVLGKCGGYTSDVIDGMRWAAGLPVEGAPANPSPAAVLNLSLGAGGTCSSSFQEAVNDVVAAGRVVVAAAGNDYATTVSQPANCDGVLAVTAHSIIGEKTSYANAGPQVAVSAPGGDFLGAVYSLSNTGTTVPAADAYAGKSGTSMATPHVAAVAALLFAAKPSLTPAQVGSYLQSSARPHPEGTYCVTDGAGLCGSGLLDAAEALYAIPAAPPTVVLAAPSQVVAPNTTVPLQGSATAEPPRTIRTYRWTQVSGASVGAIADADKAGAAFTAPATGTFSFRLTATDTTNRSGTGTAVVRVNSPPVLARVEARTVVLGDNVAFTVAATDADGDTPIFHWVSLPAGASLSAQGEFLWTDAGPEGTYTVTYYASDADEGSEPGEASITVVRPAASGGGGGGGCSIPRGGGSGGGSPWAAVLFALAFGAFLAARRAFSGKRGRG